ncbi:MAG: site-specific integrase [Pseudohongiella sp.]|nr:site-specific integrase [Pseudohongiella sp.]
MRNKQRSRQELDSSAHLSSIDVFYPSQCELTQYNGETTARFTPLKSSNTTLQLTSVEGGVIRKFPIIIRGDGTPWDLGNLYLMYKLTELAKIEPPSIETLLGIAKHLMMYLRWIEHARTQDGIVHELYFPEQDELRVTYRYHRYLRRLLKENPRPISLGVAKARMQAVVGLYRGILRGGLVCESQIAHAPYEPKAIGIPIVSQIGLKYIKQVETTNLTIKAPRREAVIGAIKDGGNLRPLNEEEQIILLEELEKYGNRAFELMCFVALFTGARLQTAATIRIKHIKGMLKSKSAHNEFLLRVGPGTDIDTKNDVNYRLHFPRKLADALEEYVSSKEHAERRANSFYGNSDENYVFLAENGSAYFTSKREIKDRQEGSFSLLVSSKDRVAFTIQKGHAVRNYIQRLIRNIRRRYPDFNHFRFHDLRATFGMNYVRDADQAGVRDVREPLRSRMGHKSFQTTQRYLNYDETCEAVHKVTVFHHNRLNRLV